MIKIITNANKKTNEYSLRFALDNNPTERYLALVCRSKYILLRSKLRKVNNGGLNNILRTFL